MASSKTRQGVTGKKLLWIVPCPPLNAPEKIRCCASCERVFYGRGKECPSCGFATYGARFVYGDWKYPYVLYRLLRDKVFGPPYRHTDWVAPVLCLVALAIVLAGLFFFSRSKIPF